MEILSQYVELYAFDIHIHEERKDGSTKGRSSWWRMDTARAVHAMEAPSTA